MIKTKSGYLFIFISFFFLNAHADNGDNIEELMLYAECTDYNNVLSTLSSEVRFISIAADPPLADPARVMDVTVSEDFIFFCETYNVIQYDKSGKYIRNVGRRGQGPGEYVQLSIPLQLDEGRKILYVTNSAGRNIMIYGFDGKYLRSIPIPFRDSHSITIIDSTTIALREEPRKRLFTQGHPFIRFINYNGKEIKSYASNLPAISQEDRKHFGPDLNFTWENKWHHYYLEYGADTIFQIVKESLSPVWKLTGNMKPNEKEYFQLPTNKFYLSGYLFRPNAAIFESDSHIIFKLRNSKESFYKVYNKSTKKFHRTFYKDVPLVNNSRKMDFFKDDMVSGLSFNPQYQSSGWAISLISAEEIVEKREMILDFIKSHPSPEGEKLKIIVQKTDEFDDNPVVMMVKFK